MTARFGRIPLDRITAEWEDGHPINPRLLAGEVAEVLCTMAPADHPIQEARASAILGATMPGGNAVTFGALAEYFHSAGQGRPAETIDTSAGPVPASHVFIWRQWLDDLAREATARAVLVAGFAMPANDSARAVAVANGSPAVHQADQPPPPTGSEPGYLKMRQAQQRKEGERSAAEQLEAAQTALKREEQKTADLLAMLTFERAQRDQHREEMGQLHRELNEERRGRLAAEESASEERRGRLEAEEKASDFADLARSLEQVRKHLKPTKSDQANQSEMAELLTVAGLLKLLLDRARPPYNQDSASDAIASMGWHGAGKRTINAVFAAAKKAGRNAESEASAKAEAVQAASRPCPG